MERAAAFRFQEYSDADVTHLEFIRRGRVLGFSLEETGQIFAVEAEPDAEAVGASIGRALHDIDARVEPLWHWRCSLLNLAQGVRHAHPIASGWPTTISTIKRR